MSGQDDEIPSMCEKHVADNRREFFREALEFVLDNQYALEVFKVLIGSGIGLECSGDVSDICFHEMVEASFVLERVKSIRGSAMQTNARFLREGNELFCAERRVIRMQKMTSVRRGRGSYQ